MRFIYNKSIKNIFDNVAEVGRSLWEKGWAEKNAGNISVNITDLIQDKESASLFKCFTLEKTYPLLKDQFLLVTSTGSRMRDLFKNPEAFACIIKISENGSGYYLLAENNLDQKPTSELPTHLAIHEILLKSGSNQKAIVHTHPDELIALSHISEFKSQSKLNQLIWSMHSEAIVLIPEGVGFIPYSLPGSEELAEKTFTSFKDHKVIIWEKHGCIAIGDDVFDAFDLIDVISKSAKIFFTCKNAGYTPEGLSEKQIQVLKEKFTH
jgi:rhamnulose-1-phosphate aldolase